MELFSFKAKPIGAAMRHLLAVLLCCFAVGVYAQSKTAQKGYDVCDQFYKGIGKDIFWFSEDSQLSTRLLRITDSLPYWGIREDKFDFPVAPADSSLSHEQLAMLDRQCTRTFITLMRDVFEGSDIAGLISNDEVSDKFVGRTDSTLTDILVNWSRNTDIRKLLQSLEPADSDYVVLKAGLQQALADSNAQRIKAVTASLNIYKWVRHFNFDKYIIVNIPTAQLTAFKGGSKMNMKVVVGKPATKTPRFSTWCDKVILYPYWNVPARIARKELVPMFKRDRSRIDKMNMQILSKDGKKIDPNSLDWSALGKGYFPYSIRQCTGCDNSLGVIKFDLTDPFSVYLHDTNYKLAFGSDDRYLSHGCIRVSEPIELGNFILENRLDSNFLKACYKDQEPTIITVTPRVPVFVVYMTAVPENDSVTYYEDVYHLFR